MKYLVLGAGPAGLTFANRLRQLNEDSFLVLEKESMAGGLCRSAMVDGAPLDIGGGHFLDTRSAAVNHFIYQFMPFEEWDIYDRNSQIQIGEYRINSPMEANIWQFPIEKQIEYLKDIAVAGCNLGNPMPAKFVDWIGWKLGRKIAEDYMIPYNTKMYGQDLNGLGTYWLDKLPDVSFEETLRSCLMRKACGRQPGHHRFLYPHSGGYGELWWRMAEAIKGHIEYDSEIVELDLKEHHVRTKDGRLYKADIIVNTIPWNAFQSISEIPNDILIKIKKLKHTSIEVRYFSENMDTDAHWIYYPNVELPYHRILVRSNFSPDSRGYWTETREERIRKPASKSQFSYLNEYAYPLNTLDKPEIMRQLLQCMNEKKVYGLGRWGEHQHYNSDVVVEKAIAMAEFCKGIMGGDRTV